MENKSKNIKGKIEVYSDENLFTNDQNTYKLNKNLEFDNSLEEENFFLTKSLLNGRIIGVFLSLLLFLTFLDIFDYNENRSVFYFIYKLIYLVIYVCIILIYNNNQNFFKFFFSITLVIKIDFLINLFVECNNDEIELVWIFFRSITFLMNVAMYFSPKLSIIFHILEVNIILAFYDINNNDFPIYINWLYNLFSTNFVLIVFYNCILVFINVKYNLNQRNLWALFDSFKKSFNTFVAIFQSSPYPILILNQNKTDQILFYNNKLEELFIRISNCKKEKLKEGSNDNIFKLVKKQ